MKILIILALVVVISAIQAAPQGGTKPDVSQAAGKGGHFEVVTYEVEEKGDFDKRFEKSVCIYDGCRCYIGTPQGQYCYGSNVYECNPTGKCCSYGYRQSCAQCGILYY